MEKNQGAVRTTISLPAELKREMDLIADQVNWSALAAEAFRKKLTELQKRNTMNQLVERLRKQGQPVETGSYQQGKKVGEAWANESATREELERIEVLRNSMSQDAWIEWFLPQKVWLHLAREIAAQSISPREALEFWRRVDSDFEKRPANDTDYDRGFAEGALAVWLEAKPLLQSS